MTTQQAIEQNIYRLVTENQQSLFQKISNPETMNRILMETNGNVPSKIEILSAIAQSLMLDENFIKENYKIITNKNASSEELRWLEQQLDESKLGVIWDIIKGIGGGSGKIGGWIWDTVRGWIWKGPKPDGPLPPPPARPRRPDPIPQPGDVDFEAYPPGAKPGWGPYDYRPMPGEIVPGLNDPDLPESYFYLTNFNNRLLELNNNIKVINESRQSTNFNQNHISYLMGLRSEIQRSNQLLEYIINGIHINNINSKL